jgi:hypothetical protein
MSRVGEISGQGASNESRCPGHKYARHDFSRHDKILLSELTLTLTRSTLRFNSDQREPAFKAHFREPKVPAYRNYFRPGAFLALQEKEAGMKRILIGIAALTIAGAAALTSANAQGVGVQVGPVGAGVGVDTYRHHHRYWHDYGYARARECRVIRERIETPSGRIIFKTRRVCD